MLINQQTMGAVFVGFNTLFNRGMEAAPSAYRQIAMVVPSDTRENVYAWLGQFPGLREWIGPRVIKNLSTHGFTIINRDFESTVSIPRNDIEDDRFGIFGPVIEELGRAAGDHPDQLIFSLLKSGFDTACYDGQFFFDTDHPVGNGESAPVSVSNMQSGSGPAWFLLDTSRAVKPLIYQARRPYRLVKKDRPEDDNVFMEKEFIYGVDGRSNAGFGLWQLAFGSKAELTPANYEAARAAMMAFKGDDGRPLNIKPDVLVAPPSLEGAAMRLLNNGTRVEIVGENDTPVAVQNEWANTAKPIITAWVA
jgi:phage major head subunit gpT-like protein